ncbi:Armadillo-type [Corchorus capsularis]|uniref:HECT-type E3 ubiquitin transferase n=1 Tax=Corchorus capsularis TaxID=210143 RepID=A0A1R3GIM1_COCAP|nr:Armadillo-type [Corchorus capsularis]
MKFSQKDTLLFEQKKVEHIFASFVPVLAGLLNHESNADIMLLEARALTHLCDVLPSSCAAVVHYGAVSCICARLLTIEYMELAEQVSCKAKGSHKHD